MRGVPTYLNERLPERRRGAASLLILRETDYDSGVETASCAGNFAGFAESHQARGFRSAIKGLPSIVFVRAAIALSLLLLPLAGSAQPWLPQVQPERASAPLIDQLLAPTLAPPQGLLVQGESVVPVWASADGRWLALVALSQAPHVPLLPLAPAFNGLADSHVLGMGSGFGSGLRWHLGNGFRIDALIGGYDAQAPVVGCPSGSCLADAAPARGSSAIGGRFGLGWLSPGGELDLSYGLTWLESDADPVPGAWSPTDGLPVLAVPGASLPFLLDSGTSLVANGRWTWSPDAPAIHFGATWGHGRVLAANQPSILLQPIDLDQASLSLGIGNDTLRGVVVGRMLSSDDPAFALRRWSALDLGVSWRTPWQGELSVGAQNVWSSSAAAPEDHVDPAQARMPYIQYRQDL